MDMPRRTRVLLSAPYLLPVLDRFRPEFEARGIELVVPQVLERLEEAELLALVEDIDGVICGDDRFTDRVLATAKRLRVICKWGTGIDSIDQAACARRGIALRNTPDAFSQPVSDTVLGYMLCFARKIPWMDAQMKAGVWDKIPSFSLRESTLGVVGVGNVGRAVIRKARGFAVRILATDIRSIGSEESEQLGIQVVSREQLLRESDFISLNCDLNPTSHHYLSHDAFSLTKANAVVINTSRGPVIDEPALIRALETGRIGGAALDVFEDEPLPPDSPLRRMSNVLLAPHNSNSSPEAWERVHRSTLHSLFEELERTP